MENRENRGFVMGKKYITKYKAMLKIKYVRKQQRENKIKYCDAILQDV